MGGTGWSGQLDGYCERLGPGLWAEPANLLTNGLFLLAAVVMWNRCAGLTAGRVLAAILLLIGFGSGLFHSLATAWAAVADVVPIALFVLAYVHLANRDFWGLAPLPAIAATAGTVALLVPLAWLAGRVLPGANAAYAAVDLLILGHGLALVRRHPPTGGRLIGGAILLAFSITARALDLPLCAVWPMGTHFLWHALNALLLGWMIEVWRRHRRGCPAAQTRVEDRRAAG